MFRSLSICLFDFFSEKPVHRIVMHPQKQSWFASAVGWNNEVSMWNVESMMRQEMLWASPKPPFTTQDVSSEDYFVIFTKFSLSLSLSISLSLSLSAIPFNLGGCILQQPQFVFMGAYFCRF